MKKYDFLFPIGGDETTTFSIAVGEELMKRGKTLCILAQTAEQDRVLKEHGKFNYYNINGLRAKIDKEKPISVIDKELHRIVAKFKISQLRSLIFPEYFYRKWHEEEYYLSLLCSFVRAFEYLFEEKVKCQFYPQLVGDMIFQNTAKVISQWYGVEHIYFGGYLIFNRFPIVNSQSGKWTINNSYVDPSGSEKALINNWIKSQKANKSKVLIKDERQYQPKIKKRDLHSFFRHLLSDIIDRDKRRNPASNTFFLSREKILPLIRSYLTKLLYRRFESGKERFIYFPLHYKYDSSLTSMAIPFVDQLYLIELIHRFLPYGYKLYVKEHPAAIGQMSLQELRKISRLKDVVFLAPSENSHDILQKASVVCVISSTVGFEALAYYRKPVITFSDTFYTSQGATIDVRNLFDLPNALIQAIDFIPKPDTVMSMLTRAYRASYPVDAGKFYNMDPSVAPQFAQALIEYCETSDFKPNIYQQNEIAIEV